jgi:hypothetical protein
MRLEKRIRALEARMITDPLVLYFADGSTRELRGRGDFVMGLFAGACGGAELSSMQAEQLELIRQSVSAKEPGGGHMTEVLRCFLNGPAEEQRSAVEQAEIPSDITA